MSSLLPAQAVDAAEEIFAISELIEMIRLALHKDSRQLDGPLELIRDMLERNSERASHGRGKEGMAETCR